MQSVGHLLRGFQHTINRRNQIGGNKESVGKSSNSSENRNTGVPSGNPMLSTFIFHVRMAPAIPAFK